MGWWALGMSVSKLENDYTDGRFAADWFGDSNWTIPATGPCLSIETFCNYLSPLNPLSFHELFSHTYDHLPTITFSSVLKDLSDWKHIKVTCFNFFFTCLSFTWQIIFWILSSYIIRNLNIKFDNLSKIITRR